MAQALGTEYEHTKPIPAATVKLLQPIYARLGDCHLLEKCIGGYTQNANESLHSLIWKFSPKEIFPVKSGIQTACSLAVCCFNDGASSLLAIKQNLGLELSPLC